MNEEISSIVVGLETVQGPEALESMLGRVEPARLVFSLDLFEGRVLMADPEGWGTDDPLGLAFRSSRRNSTTARPRPFPGRDATGNWNRGTRCGDPEPLTRHGAERWWRRSPASTM